MINVLKPGTDNHGFLLIPERRCTSCIFLKQSHIPPFPCSKLEKDIENPEEDWCKYHSLKTVSISMTPEDRNQLANLKYLPGEPFGSTYRSVIHHLLEQNAKIQKGFFIDRGFVVKDYKGSMSFSLISVTEGVKKNLGLILLAHERFSNFDDLIKELLETWNEHIDSEEQGEHP